MSFDHLPKEIRGKVASDLLRYINEDGTWNFSAFNHLNDYQRHLYALFLKQAGADEVMIKLALRSLCTDVAWDRLENYVDDIVHSSIVGIPNEAGECLPIYGEVK